jgi:large-conductance mechanosensitive channel
MIREFKGFVNRGNLVDIAVAFVMGLAFAGQEETAERPGEEVELLRGIRDELGRR